MQLTKKLAKKLQKNLYGFVEPDFLFNFKF